MAAELFSMRRSCQSPGSGCAAALVNVIGVGVAIVLRQQFAWGPIVSLIPTTLGTLGVAMLLAKDDAPIAAEQTADGE